MLHTFCFIFHKMPLSNGYERQFITLSFTNRKKMMLCNNENNSGEVQNKCTITEGAEGNVCV